MREVENIQHTLHWKDDVVKYHQQLDTIWARAFDFLNGYVFVQFWSSLKNLSFICREIDSDL